MEKITICFIDNNIRYRNSLVEYMQSYCRNYIINIHSVEHIANIHQLIDQSDIFMVDAKLFNDLLEQVSDKHSQNIKNKIIVLADNDSQIQADHCRFIFSRYSNVSTLIKHIDSMFYGSNLSAVNLNMAQTKLLVFMGISGGSGTTSIAECVASQLFKLRESRVFYLSLDTFESLKGEYNNKSQERIMYSLIKDDFNNVDKTIENNVIEIDGVWRLPPSTHMNILCELDAEEKKRFIGVLLKDKTFDYLVIDVGNQMDKFVEYLIQNALDIILIDRHNSSKSHVRGGILNSINEIKTENRESILVENFVNENGSRTYDDAIPINYQPTMVDNNKLENTGFNSQVKNVTDFIG